MDLSNMIARRRSVRRYSEEPLEERQLRQLRQAFAGFKPLYPARRVRWDILEREQVRTIQPWKAPQYICVYSDRGEGWAENIGFLFQQMDLWLQSNGLGCCWVGLGKPRLPMEEDGLEFAILLAFGTAPNAPERTGPGDFKRRTPEQISDTPDPRLEPARLAPSSTNSQPWFFTHEADALHAWCSRAGILRHTGLGTMNRMDMGIALAHLYVANPEGFHFFLTDAGKREGYTYTGSFTL